MLNLAACLRRRADRSVYIYTPRVVHKAASDYDETLKVSSSFSPKDGCLQDFHLLCHWKVQLAPVTRAALDRPEVCSPQPDLLASTTDRADAQQRRDGQWYAGSVIGECRTVPTAMQDTEAPVGCCAW
jgi:hypothetical protein